MLEVTESLDGGFLDAVTHAQGVFRSLMDAMARPGSIGVVDVAVAPPAPPMPPMPPVPTVDETVVSVPVDVVAVAVTSEVDAAVELDVPPEPSLGKNWLKSCKQAAAMRAHTMRHAR